MSPTINIDAHKDKVLSLHADQVPLTEICKVLKSEHRVSIGWKTLRRRLQEWGIEITSRQSHRREKHAELLERVRKLVCEDKFSTKKILEILAEDGVEISDTTLRRMRKDLGIKLRTMIPLN